jgi:protein SCO1
MIKNTKLLAYTIALAVLFGTLHLAAEIPPADDTLARTPPPLEVTVDEQLSADLSQLTMVDETGKSMKLGDIVDRKRPIIIAPVYYNCPHLCTLTLNGLLQAIEHSTRYRLGKDYQIITYSFHPDEGKELAKMKQANYLRKLSGVTETNLQEYTKHWRFLTGSVENIAAISKAIGFKYLKETSTNPKKTESEYVHPAVLLVTTPDLKISRYLYGVEFPEIDYRLALLEAADGKISKTIGDRLLLTCYSFDPVKRKYSLVAWRVMRLGGILTGIVLVSLLALLWYRERRSRAH